MGKEHYKNRKKVEEFILKHIRELTDKDNEELYKQMFKKMSNEEFDKLMEDFKNERKLLQVIIPPEKAKNYTIPKITKYGEKLGIKFFQRLEYEIDGKRVMTPEKYEVLDLPLRRLRQTIEKKISVATDIRKIDMLTGQVTGDSQASKVTLPEIQLLIGMGVKDTLVEFLKFRGGDLGGMRALNSSLFHYGKVSMNVLKDYAEGVISTKTLKAYFNAMHFKVNEKNQL